jgi:hypothetical protein
MNYGELITRAFHITTRHRFLWLLGILAGEGLSVSFSGGGGDGGEPAPEVVADFLEWTLVNLYLAILLALVVLFVILALVVLSVMARGGLIACVARADRQQATSFMTGMRAGYHAFWRFIGIGLLLAAIVLGAITALGLPILALALAKQHWAAVACGLLALPIMIVVAIYVGLLWMYAMRFAVLQTAGVTASLIRAHRLLFTRTKEVLLVWLIAMGLGLAAALASLLAVLLIALPFAAIGVAIYMTLGLIPTVVYAAGPALALIAGGLLLSGILTAFHSSLWTLAYLDLTTRRAHTAPQPRPPLFRPQPGGGAHLLHPRRHRLPRGDRRCVGHGDHPTGGHLPRRPRAGGPGEGGETSPNSPAVLPSYPRPRRGEVKGPVAA